MEEGFFSFGGQIMFLFQKTVQYFRREQSQYDQ